MLERQRRVDVQVAAGHHEMLGDPAGRTLVKAVDLLERAAVELLARHVRVDVRRALLVRTIRRSEVTGIVRGSFGAVLATRARRRTAALGASAPLARAAPPVLVRPAGAAPVTGTAARTSVAVTATTPAITATTGPAALGSAVLAALSGGVLSHGVLPGRHAATVRGNAVSVPHVPASRPGPQGTRLVPGACGRPSLRGKQSRNAGRASHQQCEALPQRMSGGDLLSHNLPAAVPSALWALASGFGMEPGVSPTL